MERNPDSPPATGNLDRAAMAEALAAFLRAAGLDEAANGEAPDKAATAWADELLAGYAVDPASILGETWADQTSEMVTVRSIPFVSVCAHHLLPFYGRAHLAYLPDGQLTGLSRLTALVDCLSRRLQVQERLTEQLCEALMTGLAPRGAAVLLEASHDCVGARHLEHRQSETQTIAYRGEFAGDAALQESFQRLVLHNNSSSAGGPEDAADRPGAGPRVEQTNDG